ncbi:MULTISPECIES: nuclear transport factor 2 family protein [Halostella]|uniref:nuclear transport factor 2 family protein n=1 Tax=Halostella TaxID=1843185 RepID=UPI001081FE1F|nr:MULTISPECIES: nuclear transport factor 2 family protein [Halostella]
MGNARPERVREYYRYVDDEAYEDLFSLFADDIRYDRPGNEPIEGMEEFRRFYLDERALENGTHDVHAVVPDGDIVAVRGRFEGEQGGDTVEFGFADFHRFDGQGTIVERWTYTDRDTV